MAAVADNELEAESYRHLLGQLNGRYPIEEVQVRNWILLLEQNQFEVFKPPKRSESVEQGSHALYIARSTYSSPAVQIYDLPPLTESSIHAHLFHMEILRLLRGEADIVTDLPEAVPFDQEFVAPAGKPHMVRSGNQGALVAVITFGSEDCFARDDHHFLEKPNLPHNFGLL